MPAVSVMGVMITYPLFFAATNEAFADGGLSEASGAVLARSLGDLALDSYWTRGVGFRRRITSTSWLSGNPSRARLKAVRLPHTSVATVITGREYASKRSSSELERTFDASSFSFSTLTGYQISVKRHAYSSAQYELQMSQTQDTISLVRLICVRFSC
jgi:hypothetical protein